MSYPIETKIALVREYEQGKKVAEVSKTSGIPENSIYRWIREYHTIKTASSSFTPVEYYKLQKHSTKTSLTQAFLLSLQRTLASFNLLGAMPDTKYHAAVSVIARWEREFPETFERFKGAKGLSAYSELAEAALKMYHTDREGFR